MEGKPDLVIGNYTDGNLVASLMAKKLGITQVSNLCLFLYLGF
jgi:sucrose synthase